MKIRSWGFHTLALCCFIVGISGRSDAVPIPAIDLNTLSLGAQIVGPVGPTVDTTFLDGGTGRGLADFSSGVSCPGGVNPCIPSDNQGIPGFLYTYAHEITPGDDGLSDDSPPFPPHPDANDFLGLQNVGEFRLNFSATGFNGVAGFDFDQVLAAGVSPTLPTIEQLLDGTLVWNFGADINWQPDETVRFFWQTTQPPSGPGGVYALDATDSERGNPANGTAFGPLPQPLVGPVPVPEPGPTVLALLALSALVIGRQKLLWASLNFARFRLG